MSTATRNTLFRFQVMALLALCGLAAADADVALNFRDSSMVSVASVRLSDIAEIDCSDAALKKRLASLEIGDAAPAGYSRFFGREDVALQIRRVGGVTSLALEGSPRIKVATASVSGKLSDYTKLIVDYVAGNLIWNEKDRSIVVRTERDLKFLPGPVAATVRGNVNLRSRGPLPLILTLKNAGRSIDIPLSCVVTVKTDVVVCSEQIGGGKVLPAAALRIERRDITSLASEPISAIADAAGLLTVRTVLPGTIVTGVHVRRSPDVLRGDNVIMSCKSGTVTLSIAGIAREDGSGGQTIWIENLESRKLVRAKVIGKGRVAVGEGV